MTDEIRTEVNGFIPDAQLKESSASELKANVRFMWGNSQQDWAGMDKGQLLELVGVVGEALNITPKQARGIEVIFGDHIVVNFRDGKDYINPALCLVDFDDEDRVDRVRVIINRSHELVEYASVGGSVGSERNLQKSDGISCVFEEPYENIIWFISEELKHAQLWYMAGDKATEAKWQEKYQRVMRERGIVSSDDYVTDVQEVTVSRNALKTLIRLVPKRAKYYQELYEQSLIENRHVTPSIGKIIDKTYVKTGFRPPIESV